VRSSWKSKNFDYENGNPLVEESSEEDINDDEQEDDQEESEKQVNI
jgi:hypothetical protein